VSVAGRKTAAIAKPVRPVGRPARVDLQAIFSAALELGLDQVTMKAVADRLGVGVSTLYQYVENRSELVRLAALRQALMRHPPANSGQHWAELAVQYAHELLNTLINEPQLIVELIRGGLGPQLEADVLESFLEAMQAHGFSADDGIRLYRSIGMVTLGGAVGALNVSSSRTNGAPHPQEVRRLLAERGPEQLPLIRSAVEEYQREDTQIWLMALHELLAGVAASRGETLPPAIAAARRVALHEIVRSGESTATTSAD
jgi:AcrR family transcriptional regulator